MTYALISEGVVENLISIHPMNVSSFTNAVVTADLPVSIGDTYADGVFYHDGVEVRLPSIMDEDTEDMKEALAMLEVRMNG